MAYKAIKRVSAQNLKLFAPTKTELWVQKKLENLLLCHVGKWAGGVLLATNMAAVI